MKKKSRKKTSKFLNIQPFPRKKGVFVIFIIVFLSLSAFVLRQNNYKMSMPKVFQFLSFGISKDDYTITPDPNYIFGIDISHYQGYINWGKLEESYYPVHYIFVRSTMGINGVDRNFESNWENIKYLKRIKGAYHYYRPNENSTKQFANFTSVVNLEPGDLPPILDIEELGAYGVENLRTGVLNWLYLAEKHYGVKPILYTGSAFYNDYLKGYVNDYPLWIAAYAGEHKLEDLEWTFHQFTENIRIEGINHDVDGNHFKGSYLDLEAMCIKY